MAEGTTAADDELFSAQTFAGTANGFKVYAKHGVTATPAKEGYPFVELKILHHSNMVEEKKSVVFENDARYGFPLLYYYMRNFCSFIGLEQWYLSLI